MFRDRKDFKIMGWFNEGIAEIDKLGGNGSLC